MTRTGLRRAAAVALAVPLAVGALVAGAGAAAAHAILLATTPSDGAVVRRAPSAVSLRFDEAVRKPAFLTVTGPRGRVDTGATTIDGAVVSVRLTSSSAPGPYTVAYRVVSDDGHPVEGGFAFQLAGATAPAPAPSRQAAVAQAPAAPVPPARAAVGEQGHGGHWFAALSGVAVVLAGAGALVWERLRRNAPDGQDSP